MNSSVEVILSTWGKLAARWVMYWDIYYLEHGMDSNETDEEEEGVEY